MIFCWALCPEPDLARSASTTAAIFPSRASRELLLQMAICARLAASRHSNVCAVDAEPALEPNSMATPKPARGSPRRERSPCSRNPPRSALRSSAREASTRSRRPPRWPQVRYRGAADATLEIEAVASDGFAGSKISVVRDNARQLKFKSDSTSLRTDRVSEWSTNALKVSDKDGTKVGTQLDRQRNRDIKQRDNHLNWRRGRD